MSVIHLLLRRRTVILHKHLCTNSLSGMVDWSVVISVLSNVNDHIYHKDQKRFLASSGDLVNHPVVYTKAKNVE